jgi:hypothetical protein
LRRNDVVPEHHDDQRNIDGGFEVAGVEAVRRLASPVMCKSVPLNASAGLSSRVSGNSYKPSFQVFKALRRWRTGI